MKQVVYLFLAVCSLLLTACGLQSSQIGQASSDYLSTGSTTGALGGFTVATLAGASTPLLAMTAVAGAGIGYYLASPSIAVDSIRHVGGQVFQVGDFTTIVVPSDVVFDVDTDELIPEGVPALDNIVNILSHFKRDDILVTANTDGAIDSVYAKKLTNLQAQRIASFLWASGISDLNHKRKLSYFGFGNRKPIADGFSARALRLNRRIQITVSPSKAQIVDAKEKTGGNIGKFQSSLTNRE